MKRAAILMFLLASSTAANANASHHSRESVYRCSGQTEGTNFVGGINITKDHLSHYAHVSDNYMGGQVVCAKVDADRFQCRGYWNNWSEAGRAEELDLQVDRARGEVTLNRPVFYGGKTVTFRCRD